MFNTRAKKKNDLYKQLGLAVIKASYNCFEEIKQFINVKNDKDRQELEVYLFYEFVYFFMHMINRTAFTKLSSHGIEEIHSILGPTIVETAIDTFFNHWPEEYKSKMKSEFYDKINITEIEYSKAKEIFSKKKPFTSDSLFSILARNVSELINETTNPATMTAILKVSVDNFTEMKLEDIIKKISSYE